MVKPKTDKKIGLIHADWCGHCQTLKPHWNKLKSMISGHTVYEIEDGQKDKDTMINKINSGLTGSSLAINGYPTIFKIVGKQLEYFKGDRTAESIYKWFKGVQKGGTRKSQRRSRSRSHNKRRGTRKN